MKLKAIIPIIIIGIILTLNILSLIYIKNTSEELVSVIETSSFEDFCEIYSKKRLLLSMVVRGDTLANIEGLIETYSESKKTLLISKVGEMYAENKFSLENIL